jgi:hypothetical protein
MCQKGTRFLVFTSMSIFLGDFCTAAVKIASWADNLFLNLSTLLPRKLEKTKGAKTGLLNGL